MLKERECVTSTGSALGDLILWESLAVSHHEKHYVYYVVKG